MIIFHFGDCRIKKYFTTNILGTGYAREETSDTLNRVHQWIIFIVMTQSDIYREISVSRLSPSVGRGCVLIRRYICLFRGHISISKPPSASVTNLVLTPLSEFVLGGSWENTPRSCATITKEITWGWLRVHNYVTKLVGTSLTSTKASLVCRIENILSPKGV